jgi:triphosphoribosyl-dephospho-CoA synthase
LTAAPQRLQRAPQPVDAAALGRAAVAALHDELALAPKPGLVSFIDSGSHRDMDAHTFMRSLFALRHGFVEFAALGARGACFPALQAAGIGAEARMLQATGGINTHRGAVFTLGLLCASAGALRAAGQPLQAAALRHLLRERWSSDLLARDGVRRDSHGAQATRAHGLRSANAEAALGMPVLFETTFPSLRDSLLRGLTPQRAQLQALFATLSVLDDTNLAHRGGLAGLRWAQAAARTWLAAGGAAAPDGPAHAQRLHRDFVARRLSPGGSADLLAAACWLRRVGA